MPTNTTEYQREYQKEYRKTHPQKQYKKKKVKFEIKKVKVSNLIPPRAPVKVETSWEKSGVVDEQPLTGEPKRVRHDSKTIDFSYLTTNSSFQRAIMEFIRKFVPGLEDIKVRGNKEVMKQSFNQNANNYRNVMKELKEVLKKRNE